MNSNSNPDRPTLAVIPNWLGDLVMSLPALTALRQGGRLVAVGAPPLVELLEDLDRVDEVVPYERHGIDRGLRGLWRVARRCGAHKPGLAVAFPPSLRAAALAFGSRAPRRLGFGGAGRETFLNDVPPAPDPPRQTHLTDAWLQLVGAGDGAANLAAELRAGPKGAQALKGLLEAEPGLKEPRLVLAPGATFGPTKRWAPRKFIRLANAVAAQRGWRVVVVGSSDAQERELCREIAMATQGIDLSGRTSLPALVAVLAGSRAFVGNDSGPMHLAAATGTPTLGIFGSTSPTWTAPRGKRAGVYGPEPVSCTPCFQPTCAVGLVCLEGLTVAGAHQSLGSLLGTPAAHEGRS